MKKIQIVRILKISLVILMLVSVNEACGYNEPEPAEQQKQQIEYTGTYISSDNSILSVNSTSEGYGIVIEIPRSTLIDDGKGSLNEEKDIVSFSATDSSGNPIYGDIRWSNSDEVVLEFTDSSWGYLPIGTVISFKRDNKEITGDYGESEHDSYEEDMLPYANVNSSYLGGSYSRLKAKGQVKYEVPVSGDFLNFIRDTEEDGIEYRIIDDQTYVGVSGDTIASFIQYGYPSELSVNDWIREDEFYDNPPKIIENGNTVMLAWKISNGYLLVSAYQNNNNGEWYSYRSGWIIQISSLDQCSIEW